MIQSIDTHVGKKGRKLNTAEKEENAWLADKFTSYDYTNHASFESMRAYPRRQNLYRKHVDSEKDLEKISRYYKHCQKIYDKEVTRQIKKVEDRFTSLLRHTFETNQLKTQGLLTGYNKWMNRHSSSQEFDRMFDSSLRAMASKNDFHKVEPTGAKTPIQNNVLDHVIDSDKHADRLKSHRSLKSQRSVSVDNLPRELDGQKQMFTVAIGGRVIKTPQPTIVKSMSSMSVQDLRHPIKRNVTLKKL